MAAAQERLTAAGRPDGRTEAVVRVADARRGAPGVGHAADPVGQADHGDAQSKRHDRERHRTVPARAREQRGQADAAEHGDDRRRGRREAGQAGEAEKRHRRHERDPGQRSGGEHARRPAALASAEERERPGNRDRQHGGPPQRLRRIARAALRALTAAAAGAEQVGRQPQRGDDERNRDGDRTRAGISAASTRPRGVGDQRQPALRPHERRERAEDERRARVAADRRAHGPQDQRDEQRLGHPAGDLPRPRGHVVEEQRQDDHREPRGDAPHRGGQACGQAVGQLAGEHERSEPRSAHEHEPQLRRGVAGDGERRGEDDRQRLPRRPARGIEAEVGELAAPDEPRPGVVDRLVGDQQRGPSQADAGRNDAEQAGGRHREIS